MPRSHLIGPISLGCCLALCATVGVYAALDHARAQTNSAPGAALRILVIEGEAAVNIIQQKTAVAPVVEIRDRNDLPVAGAAVTFTISGGNTATFAGGAQTLTVATNAAGRAAVSALNPLGSGAFQINVQAAFQGQTAAVTIAQTNVMTAAQATAATGGGVSSGAGGSAGGAAGGGTGGGLSTTTISVVGAGAAGGAIAAGKLLGGNGSGDGSTPPTPTPSSDLTGTWTRTFTFSDPPVSGSVASLTFALTQTGSAISGNVAITLGPPASGTDIRPVTGTVATSSPRVTIDNPKRSNAFIDRFGRPYGLCSEHYAMDPSSDGNRLTGTVTLTQDALCPTVNSSGPATMDRR